MTAWKTDAALSDVYRIPACIISTNQLYTKLRALINTCTADSIFVLPRITRMGPIGRVPPMPLQFGRGGREPVVHIASPHQSDPTPNSQVSHYLSGGSIGHITI